MAKCDREPVTGGTVENWIDRDVKSGVFHVYQLILNPIIRVKQWQPATINTMCYINTLIRIISVTISYSTMEFYVDVTFMFIRALFKYDVGSSLHSAEWGRKRCGRKWYL
jgi:hypothetical protein